MEVTLYALARLPAYYNAGAMYKFARDTGSSMIFSPLINTPHISLHEFKNKKRVFGQMPSFFKEFEQAPTEILNSGEFTHA